MILQLIAFAAIQITEEQLIHSQATFNLPNTLPTSHNDYASKIASIFNISPKDATAFTRAAVGQKVDRIRQSKDPRFFQTIYCSKECTLQPTREVEWYQNCEWNPYLSHVMSRLYYQLHQHPVAFAQSNSGYFVKTHDQVRLAISIRDPYVCIKKPPVIDLICSVKYLDNEINLPEKRLEYQSTNKFNIDDQNRLSVEYQNTGLQFTKMNDTSHFHFDYKLDYSIENYSNRLQILFHFPGSWSASYFIKDYTDESTNKSLRCEILNQVDSNPDYVLVVKPNKFID
eukprot:NODE_240_length_11935_cov_0.818773.p6 type:complete len:285 gc:universal NODE_240_length_11935_cov_0.818773:7717-6863(-)